MTTERPDRGARALVERLPIALAVADDAGSDADDWIGSEYVDRMVTSLLANGGAFLPDGFPNGWHAFRDVDPEAGCPTCGFPAWSHDPGTAFLYDRPILPDAAELERLRRIEAAAREFFEMLDVRKGALPQEYGGLEWAAQYAIPLRAALEPEGSAQG